MYNCIQHVLISLIIFCLLVLLISKKGKLKSLTIIVDLSISSLSSINFCYIYFEVPFLGAHTFRIVITFSELTLLSLFIKSPLGRNSWGRKERRVVREGKSQTHSLPAPPTLPFFEDSVSLSPYWPNI